MFGKKDHIIEKLNIEVASLTSELENITKEVTSKEQKIIELQKSLIEYQSLVDVNNSDLHEKLHKLEYVNHNYEVLMENNKDAIQEKDEKIANLEYVNKNYLKIISDNKQELVSQQAQFSEIDSSNTIYTNAIENQNAELQKKDTELQAQQETIDKLSLENDKNNQVIANIKGEFQATTDNLTQLQATYSELVANNEVLLKDVSELKKYQSSFMRAGKIYDAYKQTGHQLDTIVHMEQDPLKIYIYFLQKANIDRLWEYVRTGLLKNKDDKNFLVLQEFLYLAMEEFFLVNPRYKFTPDPAGSNFNILKQELHASSKEMVGVLSEIILKGYFNSKTKNVMKQSVVTLK